MRTVPLPTEPTNGPPSLGQRAWRRLRGLLFPRYWIALTEDDALRVVIESDGVRTAIDGSTRTVLRDDKKVLAAFDALQSIDIVHQPARPEDDVPEHWLLSLYLGRSMRLNIARSRKQPHVAKAAARVSRITGVPVREAQITRY